MNLDQTLRELLSEGGYIVYLFNWNDVIAIGSDIGYNIDESTAKDIVRFINASEKDANLGINNEVIETYIDEFFKWSWAKHCGNE
jgi:hypothetical protein